jgi:hypothetical protein
MDEKTKVLIPDKVQTIKAHLTKVLIDGFIAFDS